jgi:hypothetical protein
MASSNPVSFTVEFDQVGDVIRVVRADGGPVTQKLASNMSQMLANVTVCKSTVTEVLICDSPTGQADPCVIHAGDLWCW